MATATVTVQRGDHLANFNTIFGELGQAHMTIAVNVVKGAVQQNSPVNLGVFRGGITTQVSQTAAEISGSVFSQDDPIKVEVLESGRAAGTFAPVDVITRWVALVIRPPANMLRSISFLVNRAIMQRGIPGRHVFQRSFEQTEAQVNQILKADLTAALAARL